MDTLRAELKKRGFKKLNDEGFVYFQLEKPESFLNFCIKEGYLLHGSTRAIRGKLVPHKANDLAKEFGNQEGIYLTDAPIVAMFSAITGGVNIKATKHQVSSERDSEGNINYPKAHFAVARPHMIQDEGFVYVFSGKVVDASEGSEYISKRAIMPIVVIKISRGDFRFSIDKMEANGAKRGS